MVAVNPRFTLLAFSLASLSLSPSADAAAIRTRSDPGSPSKPARHAARAPPMPMRMVKVGKNTQELPNDVSKRGKLHQSEAFAKRQQEQARFGIKHPVARRSPAAPRDVSPGTPGRVDITSPTANNESTTIGHLLLNTTSTPYVLDASQNNMTTLYMVPSESDPRQCSLQTPIATAQNATSPYCATFNPQPPAPEPLTMEPCFNATDPMPHKSQTFSYDHKTGVIQPMWFTGEDDGMKNTTSSSAVSAQDVDSGNGDTDNSDDDFDESVDPPPTLNSRDPPPAQDVTLVFVPSAPEKSNINAQEVSPSSESISSAPTETVTTTVTETATPSSAAADVDLASSTTDSSSQSASVTSSDPFASATSLSYSIADVSASTTDSSVSSTPSPTDTSVASSTSPDASSVAALNVEVAAPSSTDSSFSSTPTPAADASTASSDSSVPSASASTVDASAIAADIAASSASYSESASAVPSPSSSVSASDAAATPPSSDEQAVYVVGQPAGPAARAMMTPVSTDPYKYRFRV
ncbi:hypothetical protein C8R43DRAFT_997509 [Mycena crocata]|nr:hypothetical protein C8R43DRAFT_997509 [Mycena crocata]